MKIQVISQNVSSKIEDGKNVTTSYMSCMFKYNNEHERGAYINALYGNGNTERLVRRLKPYDISEHELAKIVYGKAFIVSEKTTRSENDEHNPELAKRICEAKNRIKVNKIGRIVSETVLNNSMFALNAAASNLEKFSGIEQEERAYFVSVGNIYE